MKSEMQEIIDEIKKFRNNREWQQFHDGKNLAISLSIEASELLESFLWKKESEIDRNNLKHELADVFYNAFLISDLYEFNVKDIIMEKLTLNELKYPIDKSKGINKKYNEL